MIQQTLPDAASATLTISSTSISLRDAIRATGVPAASFEFLDGANSVTLTVVAADIYYRTDGIAVDTTNGIPLYTGGSITLEPQDLDKIRMIRLAGVDATVKVIQIAKKKSGEI